VKMFKHEVAAFTWDHPARPLVLLMLNFRFSTCVPQSKVWCGASVLPLTAVVLADCFAYGAILFVPRNPGCGRVAGVFDHDNYDNSILTPYYVGASTI